MKQVNEKNQFIVDGLLLVDKPSEWTSHDVCDFLRRVFHIKKVGHAGTLDPMATGLLVMLLGHATKRSNDLLGLDKSYEGTIELGVKTDTHDRKGKVIEEKEWSHITFEDVQSKIEQFSGDLLQVPPMVSALKHKGQRLYKLARKGQEVEREPRPIKVYRFDLHQMKDQFIDFSMAVSKGTYVRTLANDLGEELGTVATLSALRRTTIGSYQVGKSLTVEALQKMSPEEFKAHVIPMSQIISNACHSPS
jgi:tRNA pseudouridine55 synthase